MPEEKEFTKIHAEVPVAREVKAIAAMQGKPVYKVVEEMLETYKAAAVETLPAPKGGKKAKVVKATRVH
jgi:hypothetical protein